MNKFVGAHDMSCEEKAKGFAFLTTKVVSIKNVGENI
jgi:hypothetical protein